MVYEPTASTIQIHVPTTPATKNESSRHNIAHSSITVQSQSQRLRWISQYRREAPLQSWDLQISTELEYQRTKHRSINSTDFKDVFEPRSRSKTLVTKQPFRVNVAEPISALELETPKSHPDDDEHKDGGGSKLEHQNRKEEKGIEVRGRKPVAPKRWCGGLETSSHHHPRKLHDSREALDVEGREKGGGGE